MMRLMPHFAPPLLLRRLRFDTLGFHAVYAAAAASCYAAAMLTRLLPAADAITPYAFTLIYGHDFITLYAPRRCYVTPPILLPLMLYTLPYAAYVTSYATLAP